MEGRVVVDRYFSDWEFTSSASHVGGMINKCADYVKIGVLYSKGSYLKT